MTVPTLRLLIAAIVTLASLSPLALVLRPVSVEAFTDDANLQTRLAEDALFKRRVEYSMLKVAANVLAEDAGTANHAERIARARVVRDNPQAWAALLARWLVVRPNLIAFTTTANEDGTVTTNAGDSDIFSQITADWNLWSDIS